MKLDEKYAEESKVEDKYTKDLSRKKQTIFSFFFLLSPAYITYPIVFFFGASSDLYRVFFIRLGWFGVLQACC